jgi:hypothetical protein
VASPEIRDRRHRKPAAGLGFTYPNPGTVDQTIVSVSFKLVNAAVAVSRIPTLSFLDQDGTAFAAIAAPFTTGTGVTSRYLFAVGINQFGANNAANIGVPIPPFKLYVGTSLSLAVTAEDAGDQISEIRLTVAKWPVRP